MPTRASNAAKPAREAPSKLAPLIEAFEQALIADATPIEEGTSDGEVVAQADQ